MVWSLSQNHLMLTYSTGLGYECEMCTFFLVSQAELEVEVVRGDTQQLLVRKPGSCTRASPKWRWSGSTHLPRTPPAFSSHVLHILPSTFHSLQQILVQPMKLSRMLKVFPLNPNPNLLSLSFLVTKMEIKIFSMQWLQ